MERLPALFLLGSSLLFAQSPDFTKLNDEAMRHFQALVQLDTTNPPGNETRVAEYVKKVLEAEGIPVTLAAKDPARANVIARLKGNGSKRPLLIMGHSDTVQIDPAKWTFGPFSATRNGGYVYGRGSLDDKPDVLAGMMTMLLLKRGNVKLDRDVIFAVEVGEEASTGPGIEYLVNERWDDMNAEFCLAEGGGVRRQGGQTKFAVVQTTEKQPRAARLISHGPSGHGSRPLRTNAILHLSSAIEKVALWDPPMRLNDTTRHYFEKLSTVSTPEESARFRGLLDPEKAPAIRTYLAENDPGTYSMLHTSISPNIIKAGFQVNVIPSEAEATLDIRALPDENITEFYDMMRKVINDPTIELVPESRNQRPGAAPSRLDSDAYKSIEASYQKVYGVITVPMMSTGATDMAFLRAKGMNCYGVGVMSDTEDAAKGFGAHSDQERVLEEAVYKHLQFMWNAVTGIAASKN
jgi:acetylornithine deacetylase/succinyl-diaminopimelate desuccinylase-like protein